MSEPNIIETLRLSELAFVEEYTGVTIDELDNASRGKLMTALVTVVKRREDKKFNVKQAEDMTMQEASDVLNAAPKG